MTAASETPKKATEVGSVFVSNYPPFSVWNQDALADARHALNEAPQLGEAPRDGVPLGLYLHVPFCRRR